MVVVVVVVVVVEEEEEEEEETFFAILRWSEESTRAKVCQWHPGAGDMWLSVQGNECEK